MDSILSERLAQSMEKGGGFGFAISPENCVEALRNIADGIAEGRIVVMKATQYRVASHDAYEVCGVVLHFAERLPEKEPEVVELRGNGEQFPIDAQRTGE